MRRRPIARLLATLAVLGALCAAPTMTGTGHAASTPDPTTSTPDATTPTVGAELIRGVRVTLTPVASVTGGTSLAFRRDDPTLYLARQKGTVVPITDGEVGAPILDVRKRMGTEHREQGLLGLAFSPDGRRAYVYYTATTGADTLEEYRVTHRNRPPVRLAASSRRTVLVVPHEHPQHNGGQLAFGPDKMLYVAIGDGGGHRGTGLGQVPGGNSQSLENLLGKILRIDPRASGHRPYTVPADNPFVAEGVAPEIWHYGLRNPWRFSFDARTGDLWIGDVGQDHWEEIDVVPPLPAGRNFGYPLLEGTHALNADTAPGTTLPVWELWHRSGNCAVTGGYVYRGREIHELRGLYVFVDYCNGKLKALRVRDGRAVGIARLRARAPLVSSFAEDAAGELYVVSQVDGVLRIDPRR